MDLEIAALEPDAATRGQRRRLLLLRDAQEIAVEAASVVLAACGIASST